MSVRISTLAAGLALAACGLPASAQIVSTAPLSQVDPWGVGWLGKADGALDAGLWGNTDAETLTPLFTALQPAALSPAARAILRRVVMSSTKAPDGAADLVNERLRLIEQIGETARSIDLRRKFPKTDWGKAVDKLASEYDLAAGRTQDGCARVANTRADDPDWMPLRALCLALAKDYDAAGMIAEQTIAGGDAIPAGGSWLIAAIETMRSPTRTKPDGRYGSAMEAAVSIYAKLSAAPETFRNMPEDLALAILHHPAATLDQRRAALRQAIDSGQVKTADVLAVLSAKEEAPAAGATPARKTAAPRADFLTPALDAIGKDNAAAQATAYAVALKGAEGATDFRIAAVALGDAIRKLPQTDASLPHAETFARAALITGDAKAAADWRKLMDKTPEDKADAWSAARIDLMLALADHRSARAAAILDSLIAAVPPPPEGAAARNPTPAQRQADLRRIENARILFLYAGSGRAMSPSARGLLAGQRTAGRGVSDAVLSRVHAALDAKATGEALLAAAAQLSGDTSAISFAGLSDLMALLVRAGFEKEADALFLDAMQVWKAL